MGVQVFVIPFVLPSVSHVHMAMEEVLRMILFHQRPEHLKTLMRQVTPVI